MYRLPEAAARALSDRGLTFDRKRWLRRDVMCCYVHVQRHVREPHLVDVEVVFGGRGEEAGPWQEWGLYQYSQAGQAGVAGGYYDSSRERGRTALEADLGHTLWLLDMSSNPAAVCGALLAGTLCPGMGAGFSQVPALRDALEVAQAYGLSDVEQQVLDAAARLLRDSQHKDAVQFWLATRGVHLGA